jgi:hypothetical protein
MTVQRLWQRRANNVLCVGCVFNHLYLKAIESFMKLEKVEE